MSKTVLASSASWRPATFLERGVAVPFTTPTIAQSRCRPSSGKGAELIIPNPSGGEGQYIIPITSTGNFCTPSLHDQYILDGLSDLDHIAPAAIRQLANEAARKGLAGRSAAKAARDRGCADENAMVVSYMAMLAHVLRQAGYKDADWRRLDVNDPALRAQAKRYLTSVAPEVGMSADKLLSELESVSRAIAFVGVAGTGVPSPAETQLRELDRFRKSLDAWSRDEAELQHVAQLIVESASMSLEKTAKVTRQCRQVTADIVGLFKRWRADQAKMVELFTLPDWLLDGWPYIAALWHSVQGHERPTQREVVQRIAELVPLQPKEVDRWLGADSRGDVMGGVRKGRVKLNEDWRSGAQVVNSREHNEQLRMAA